MFGTRVEILIAGLDEEKARPAANAVLQEFDRLHRTYHAWEPSQLKSLNDAIAAKQPFTATPEMLSLIKDAQRFSSLSDGRFDPGIGKLIHIWGFQSDEFKPILPPADAIKEWKEMHAGIANLVVEENTIHSSNPNVSVDLGGYLKGYALDRAAAILRERGINNALINIGGNVMALGTKNGDPWRIGIQHPRQPGPLATLELHDGEAIGTSGDYQRFFELNGQRYCHLLDPRTGEPVTTTQAVTILIPAGKAAGTLSDAGSKPLFISGANWPKMAAKFGLDQVLRIDASGQIEVTEKMKDRLKFSDGQPQKPTVITIPAP